MPTLSVYARSETLEQRPRVRLAILLHFRNTGALSKPDAVSERSEKALKRSQLVQRHRASNGEFLGVPSLTRRVVRMLALHLFS